VGRAYGWIAGRGGAAKPRLAWRQTNKSFLFPFFKKESAFFFEKKKQKTFYPFGITI
jgi:hypothetical protein